MLEGPPRGRGKEPEASNDDELPVLSDIQVIRKREEEERNRGKRSIEMAREMAREKLDAEWNAVFEAIRKAPEIQGKSAQGGKPLAEELIHIIETAQLSFINTRRIPDEILARIREYQIPGMGDLRAKVRELLGKMGLHLKEKE